MDSMLQDRIRNITLTKTQQQIAQFMVEHEYVLSQMSLMDISNAIGVSDASVLRFVRQIGFDGFNSFKDELYNDLISKAGGQVFANDTLSHRMKSQPIDNGQDISQSVIDTCKDNIEKSILQNNQSVYNSIIDDMGKCKALVICGTRGTIPVAMHFATILRYLYPNVIYLDHSNEVYPTLSNLGKSGMLILFCVSRFYKKDIHICECAKASGMPICLITDYISSPITKYAKHILIEKSASKTFGHSLVGLCSICEYIVSLILAQKDASFIKRLDEIDKYSEDERWH